MLGRLSHIALLHAVAVWIASALLMSAPVHAAKKVANKEIDAAEVNGPVLLPAHLSHARTFFRRHDYRTALLMLDGAINDTETRFIAGESHFRLGHLDAAKRYFKQIADETKDPIERRKALIRLFDIDVREHNIQDAIDRYVAFAKEYKKPTAQMRYSLGKALYDTGYFERSEKMLRAIPKGNEFFLRARYIVATMNLEKKKPEEMAKFFGQIEAEKPVSTEDYVVHELAILAQGRIFAQAGKEDLADKAYARVKLAGEYGEVATRESVRMQLTRATEARLGQGRFKKSSTARRKVFEAQAIQAALKSITRYRKASEIDWRKPELLTLMARLYVESKRYDDARLAYQELIGHYRPLYDDFKNEAADEKVWAYFSLDFAREQHKAKKFTMLPGVPDVLVRGLPDVEEILSLRDRIEANQQKLSEQWELSSVLGGSERAAIDDARATQLALVIAYNEMVIKKQRKIKKAVADILNRSLAEAEFKRAELVVLELQDLKKQQDAVHSYQSEKLDAFSDELKKLEEGGSI